MDDDDRRPGAEELSCRICRGALRFSAAIPPAMGEPGHRIFRCDGCGRVEWVSEPAGKRG